MAILLVIGIMDLRAMAVVAAAITLERLAPAGERVARAIGAVVVGQGCSDSRASGSVDTVRYFEGHATLLSAARRRSRVRLRHDSHCAKIMSR